MKSDDAEFNASPEIQNALNGCIIKVTAPDSNHKFTKQPFEDFLLDAD